MSLVNHVLNHMLNHMLDYMLNHMIIGLMTIALQLPSVLA